MHFWDLLHRWDQILTLFLNQIHNPATDQFMVFMSDRAAWFPMYAFVAFCLVWRLGWKKGLISIVCVALTLLACDQTANLLKYSVARLRPCYSSYMLFGGLHVLETRGSLFGFFPPTLPMPSALQCVRQCCSAMIWNINTRPTSTRYSFGLSACP